MLLGILADSHDRLPTLQAALGRFETLGIQTVLHAGDIIAPFAAKLLAEYAGQVHVVYGNNDGERHGLRQTLPQIVDGPAPIDIAGRKFLLHHFIDWCPAPAVEAAEVVVTGHTHEVVVERRDGKLLLNPGECCGWLTGRCTAAVLDLDTMEPEIIEIPT